MRSTKCDPCEGKGHYEVWPGGISLAQMNEEANLPWEERTKTERACYACEGRGSGIGDCHHAVGNGRQKSSIHVYAAIAAPGIGLAATCRSCLNPFVVVGSELIDPNEDGFVPPELSLADVM
jgi:hypothetical protein